VTEHIVEAEGLANTEAARHLVDGMEQHIAEAEGLASGVEAVEQPKHTADEGVVGIVEQAL
jgi:hypothetical protein